MLCRTDIRIIAIGEAQPLQGKWVLKSLVSKVCGVLMHILKSIKINFIKIPTAS